MPSRLGARLQGPQFEGVGSTARDNVRIQRAESYPGGLIFDEPKPEKISMVLHQPCNKAVLFSPKSVLAMSYLCQKFTKCPLPISLYIYIYIYLYIYIYIRYLLMLDSLFQWFFFSAESSQAQNSPGKWLGQHISPQHFIQPPLEDDDLSIVTRRGHTQPANQARLLPKMWVYLLYIYIIIVIIIIITIIIIIIIMIIIIIQYIYIFKPGCCPRSANSAMKCTQRSGQRCYQAGPGLEMSLSWMRTWKDILCPP